MPGFDILAWERNNIIIKSEQNWKFKSDGLGSVRDFHVHSTVPWEMSIHICAFSKPLKAILLWILHFSLSER